MEILANARVAGPVLWQYPISTKEEECCICFEKMCLSILPCIHKVCPDCVKKVNRCPTCQTPLVEHKIAKEDKKEDRSIPRIYFPTLNSVALIQIQQQLLDRHKALAETRAFIARMQHLPAYRGRRHRRQNRRCGGIIKSGPRRGHTCNARVKRSTIPTRCGRHRNLD